MMSNKDAEDYVDHVLPEMLGQLSPTDLEKYECFVRNVKYLIKLNKGIKPKNHKGRTKIRDYWTCGNCGTMVFDGVGANFCAGCGEKILWDSIRCLTGVNENDD